MIGSSRYQRLSALVLCALVVSPGFAQSQAQTAPADQTAPATQQPQTAPEAPAPNTVPASPPAATPTIAQQAQQIQQQNQTVVASPQPFHVQLPHSRNPLSPYRPSFVPPVDLTNSPRLQSLIREGKLYISLRDAIALAIENNLDLASFRYNLPTALTDLARTRAGGYANGVSTNVTSPVGASGGSVAGSSVSSGAAAGGSGGLVTSTLGEGTYVNPFDPVFTVKALVDHTKTPEVNTIQTGVNLLETNSIGYTTQYTEYFPSGTGIQWALNGQRVTSNSPFNIVDPQIQLFWEGHSTPAGGLWVRHQRAMDSNRKEEPADHRLRL